MITDVAIIKNIVILQVANCYFTMPFGGRGALGLDPLPVLWLAVALVAHPGDPPGSLPSSYPEWLWMVVPSFYQIVFQIIWMIYIYHMVYNTTNIRQLGNAIPFQHWTHLWSHQPSAAFNMPSMCNWYLQTMFGCLRKPKIMCICIYIYVYVCVRKQYRQHPSINRTYLGYKDLFIRTYLGYI